MPPTVQGLRRLQIGKESTRGTLVAATRQLIGEARYRRTVDLYDSSEQDFGLTVRTARAPIDTRHLTEIEITAPLDTAQVLMPLLSGMKGGVTGVGAGADKTWTFTPDPDDDPLPDTYTLEYSEDDGTTTKEMEAGYGFCPELEITGGDNGVAQARWSIVARKTADSTLTPAIALPTDVNIDANLLWTMFIDDTWGGLGGTQKTGQIYGFTWRWTWLKPQYYLDGRTALDFSTYDWSSKRVADLTIDTVVGSNAGDVVPTEEPKRDAGTARYIRAKMTGATVGGAVQAVQVDGAYYHAADSMQERGGERDGNPTTRLHLMSAYDSGEAKDVEVVVSNGITSFP